MIYKIDKIYVIYEIYVMYEIYMVDMHVIIKGDTSYSTSAVDIHREKAPSSTLSTEC